MIVCHTNTKFIKAHEGTDELDKDKLAGDFILAIHYGTARSDYKIVARIGLAKIYYRKGYYYTIPRRGKKPAGNYVWKFQARRYSRSIYMARKIIHVTE